MVEQGQENVELSKKIERVDKSRVQIRASPPLLKRAFFLVPTVGCLIFTVQNEVMSWRILIIILHSCASVASFMKVTTKLNNGLMEIMVDIGNITDKSEPKCDCIFHSDTNKVLLSTRLSDSEDQQFKGRVTYNISEDVMKIMLSKFSIDDVGNYTCKYFDKRGEILDRGCFTLKWPLPTPTSGPAAAEGATQQPGGPNGFVTSVTIVAVVIALGVVGVVGVVGVLVAFVVLVDKLGRN